MNFLRMHDLCWGFFQTMSKLEVHVLSWEIVEPRKLKVSTVDNELSRMLSSVVVGWLLHYHLPSFEQIQIQVVLTVPVDQLFYSLSAWGLVTVLDQIDDCVASFTLQEFHCGVSWDTVTSVEGEEEWGGDTPLGGAPVLMVWMLDVRLPSLTCCLLSVRS